MDIRGRRILVTGGAGFVGSHLVDRLVELDCEVTVLDDLSNGSRENLEHAQCQGGARLVTGSVADAALTHELIVAGGCDVVFHLAALNLLRSIEDPARDLQVNAAGTLNVLRCVQESRTKPIMVFSSTGSVYGNPAYQPQDERHPLEPVSPYGVSKLAAEKYVLLWAKLFGVRTVALRYYNVYGPRQGYHEQGGVVGIFLSRVLNGFPPVIEGTGLQERCFTYVSDVVQANLLAAQTDSAWADVYNVGTTEITTILDLAKMVLCLCECDLAPNFAERRLGDVDLFRPDIRKAQKAFGYSPHVLLSEGLRRTMNWFVETGRAPAIKERTSIDETRAHSAR
jgi:UDP-glucose 4-epimerase